jgi:DNA-binding GntR family transcriptional regulator
MVAPLLDNQDSAMSGSKLQSERAYEVLEEKLVTLEIPPDSVLSEVRLAQEIGFGRMPVREALKRLAREGLVRFMPARGVVVSGIDANSQIRLLEVRRALEGLVVSLAAERAHPKQIEKFKELTQTFRGVVISKDEIAFMRADKCFNELILTASHNAFCTSMMSMIQGLSRRFFFRYRDAVDLSVTASLHADIAEAISCQNSDLAIEAANALSDYNVQFAMKTIKLP